MADYYKTNYYIGDEQIIIDTNNLGYKTTDYFLDTTVNLFSGNPLFGGILNQTYGAVAYDFSKNGSFFADTTKTSFDIYKYGSVCYGGSPNLTISSGTATLKLTYNETDKSTKFYNGRTLIKNYSGLKLNFITLFIALVRSWTAGGGSNEGAGGRGWCCADYFVIIYI